MCLGPSFHDYARVGKSDWGTVGILPICREDHLELAFPSRGQRGRNLTSILHQHSGVALAGDEVKVGC